MVWRLVHTGSNKYSAYNGNWTRDVCQSAVRTTFCGGMRVEYADGYQKVGIREGVHILANNADCPVSVCQPNPVAVYPSVTHRTISQRGWFPNQSSTAKQYASQIRRIVGGLDMHHMLPNSRQAAARKCSSIDQTERRNAYHVANSRCRDA